MLREEVLNLARENESLLLNITANPEISQLIKEMAKTIKLRIDRIKEVCTVSEYTLCFIGNVGVGKSTAISNLLDLTIGFDNIESKKLDDMSLMPTAAGRTTACETTIILHDDDMVKIEIEKMGIEEFERIVSQYADFILHQNSEETEKLPTEVKRIIRNMSKFPEDDDEDMQEAYISKLPSAVNVDKKTELVSALLSKINYEHRSVLTLTCDNDNYKLWLKNTLSALNNGTIENVPYPLNTTIFIKRGYIDAPIPKFITKIKDTRGIDGNSTRDDVIKCCNDIHSICLLCDSITQFGNIVSDTFLKNQFVDSNIDIKFRNILLGLEKNNELEDVNEGNGREIGKRKKIKETKSNFQGIYFEEKNMLFYDSFLGISYDNKHKITGIDSDQYVKERDAIFNRLAEAMDCMYNAYGDELEMLSNTLYIFKKNTVTDDQNLKLSRLRDEICSCKKEYVSKHKEVIKDLNISIRNHIQAGFVRGAVNRNGEYYNFNIYSEVENYNLNYFDESVSNHKYYIQKQVQEIFEHNDPLEDAMITAIEYKIKQEHQNFRIKDSNDFRKTVYQALISNPCWKTMQSYWGNNNGIKYRDRIADSIFEEIKTLNIVPTVINNNNIPLFYDSLLELISI